MRPQDEIGWQPLTCTAQDGLELFARDYDPPDGMARLPAVCLPGLARSSADFQELALQLSRDSAFRRRVIAVDYRGRGRSGHDRNWENYTVQTEAADLLALLTVAGVHEAIFIGTSRGGLITFMLGVLRPGMIRGAVLNDVGPVIDGQGLARIRQYVGKLPAPRTWDEATDILKTVSQQRFPAFDDRDWRKMAERTWKEANGKLVVDYDPALQKGLAALNLEQPLPELWDAFIGLAHAPVLSIRGANSDLLSAQTQAEMAKRHPNCRLLVVEGQGHAPALDDAPTLMEITKFCDMVDPAH